MEMSNTVVLYPSPGIGHLVSMVELGKLIVAHHPQSLSHVIILITNAPGHHNSSTSSYISRVSATNPSITFHQLPPVPLSSDPTLSIETMVYEFLIANNPNVHKALQSFLSTKTSRILAFVVDIFCSAATEVSSSLNIPTYFFFTSGASILSSFLHLPVIHETTTTSIKDLDAFLDFPGLPPIFSLDVLKPVSDRNLKEYKYFMQSINHMSRSSGVIINTFQSLEPRALAAITNGLCNRNAPAPPIYCVGPLIATNSSNSGEEHECLMWLNSQPSRSVVFLCFGSQGMFKQEQVKEMAQGLENSGHRFLWVVRNPPLGEHQPLSMPKEPDLDALLPQGFLERTKGRGLVVKMWAPQIAVLNHDAVGGFVTHCGWNSILEAMCAGVPMIGWPLYAEQRMNKVVLVEELKLGLALEECGEEKLVSAGELTKQVRELMDPISGELLRRRVRVMRDAAKAALETENGSSSIALASLISKWVMETNGI